MQLRLKPGDQTVRVIRFRVSVSKRSTNDRTVRRAVVSIDLIVGLLGASLKPNADRPPEAFRVLTDSQPVS